MSTSLQLSNIAASIKDGGYDGAFTALYPGRDAASCRDRYLKLIDLFNGSYADSGRAVLISAPGRAEVCGNHTDHQHGNVLAAAVDQDIICVAALNGGNFIRLKSVGHAGGVCVNLDDLSPKAEERGSDSALIRGIAAWFTERGVKISGFDAYTESNVPIGSGLSSSAAFEVAVGAAVNALFNAGISPLNIAIAGQFAENNYFGKPCGLMDQTASSVGGFVRIDFNDPKDPIVEPIQFDLASHGLRLCVVNTKGSHADLIGEYASIPAEMKSVAACFGKSFLRDVDEDDFYKNIAGVRAKLTQLSNGEKTATAGEKSASSGENSASAGEKSASDNKKSASDNEKSALSGDDYIAADRAILRAIHFFDENRLVDETADALRSSDTARFLENITKSGHSSFCYLQNIYAAAKPGEQGLSLALALSDAILRGNGGAWRVHGGGFAGTIMAFVPDALYVEYIGALGAIFGGDACITLSIRKCGGVAVTPDLT